MKNILILFAVLFFFNEIAAIPAFARKYNMSCKTCHSPAPSLKAFGEEFAGNGFKLADQDAPRYFVNTGDDELSLIRDLPLALRMEGYLSYTNSNESNSNDFSAPYILKILSGGALSDNIAYYFYFFFSERGEVAGIEDAFVMFNDIFSTDLDIYLGQFQVSDPLFKRELRLSFEDYQVYRLKPGLSDINLTYDRGIMFTYGLNTGTDFTFELLNGSGIGSANQNRMFDKDKYKNLLGRISQDITSNIRIGGFGYWGKEELAAAEGVRTNNSLWMAGPDLTITAGPLELNAQYVERNDDNPLGTGKTFKTRGAFSELVYRPEGDDSKWYGMGIFNWTESELKEEENPLNYKSATFHLGYLLRRNIRLAGEYTYNFTDKFGRAGIGFISAF